MWHHTIAGRWQPTPLPGTKIKLVGTPVRSGLVRSVKGIRRSRQSKGDDLFAPRGRDMTDWFA